MALALARPGESSGRDVRWMEGGEAGAGLDCCLDSIVWEVGVCVCVVDVGGVMLDWMCAKR